MSSQGAWSSSLCGRSDGVPLVLSSSLGSLRTEVGLLHDVIMGVSLFNSMALSSIYFTCFK